MRIVETNLVSSTGRVDKLPEPEFPEVAFAGRSNVGKSSLLNAITNRKGLFKVSKTPGRTRTIVHVETRFDTGAKIYLVDLPGYGYAKVAKGAMRAWRRFVEEYLSVRSTLHLVVLLVDVRRGPEQEEVDLLDYLADSGVPAILVGTKIDRVRKSKRFSILKTLRDETGVKIIGTSATDRTGLDALIHQIAKASGFGESQPDSNR